MKMVFFGGSEFSIYVLDELKLHGILPELVITTPDKPKGRKLVITPTPVKIWAQENNIEVIDPASLKKDNASLIAKLKGLNSKLFLVASYGKIIPKEIFEIPECKTLNIHPSLLPKYRGAAPIAHAILNGESETGVTVLYISEKMDAGDIIARNKIPVLPSDTCGSLSSRLAEAGSSLLVSVIDDIESGRASRTPQDEKAATLAPKIEKPDGLIDWNLSAEEISRRIRAFNPWPGAWTFIESRGGKVMLKIIEAGVGIGAGVAAGLIGRCDVEGIHVGTGSGCLLLKRLQPEGRKVMSAAEFARGHRTLQGMKLG